MSNLSFARNINSFADAESFLHGKQAKQLCYATAVTAYRSTFGEFPRAIAVAHHGHAIAEFRKVADVLYIPAWTDHRYSGKYANVYGIDQFEIITSFDNHGYATNTTANRLHRLIPEYAPRGLAIGVSNQRMVARLDGYEYAFDTLHFSLSGDVIAYRDGKPYRVAQRRAVDFR